MNTKALIWIGLFIGSTVGGYLPSLFHQDIFSMWSIVGSTVGSFLGIWVGYKLGEDWLA